MAGSVNKAIIVGNLGRDPEVRYTSSGQAVCSFTVATSDRWKDKQGEQQERTEWHRIVAWGRLGEICGQYLSKGRTVYVEGRLQTREWTNKEGHRQFTTEIVAAEVQFLGGGGGARGGQGGGQGGGYGGGPGGGQGGGYGGGQGGGQGGGYGGGQGGGQGGGYGGGAGGGQGGGYGGGPGGPGGGQGGGDYGPPPEYDPPAGPDDDIPF